MFERKVLLDDLLQESNAKRDLPGEWTPEEILKEHTKFTNYANANPKVQKALADRKELWDSIKSEYINTMDQIGFNVEDRFTKEDYFRHQVLEYANAKGLTGTGKRYFVIKSFRVYHCRAIGRSVYPLPLVICLSEKTKSWSQAS